MAKDLTSSNIERQNILNNRIAIPRIQEAINVKSLKYNGKYYLTKQMVADFYGVDVRTIDNYLSTYEDELKHNGYVLCRCNMLKDMKLHFAHENDFASKTTQLGLFDFRSFLNIGMLLVESEKAKQLRSVILDIVISTINEKAGGGTKFINWRDREFLPAAIQEDNYRKNFTSAINECVDGHPTFKYSQVTDMVYKAVFFEKAKEYKTLLHLKETDNARATMYAEVLRVISSFENGVGAAIRDKYNETKIKMSLADVQDLIDKQAKSPVMTPFLYDARQKMASRDFCHVNPEKAPDGKLVGTVAEYISELYQDMQTDETLLFLHYLESGLFGKVTDMHDAEQFISALDEYFRHTDIVIKDYLRRRLENIRRYHSENGSLSSPSLEHIPTAMGNAAAYKSAMTVPSMPSNEG